MKICFFLLLLFSAACPLEARTIVVDPGSASSPPSYYKTIKEALEAAAADSTVDTIEIMEGPIFQDGEWAHVLWDSKQGLNGSESGRLKTPFNLSGVTIKGDPNASQIVTTNGNGADDAFATACQSLARISA